VFENRVLRIFGSKRDEVMGDDWRKLHNKELHNMYTSPNIIRMIKSRRMRWAGHVARMGKTGMHIGYRWESLKEGRPRHRWVDNIKIDRRDGMDLVHLSQDRDQWRVLVNMVMNLCVP
jgi:hypothetical protein